MNKKLTAAAAAIAMSSLLGIAAYAQAPADDGAAGVVENVGEGAGDIIENIGEGVGEVAEGVGDAASDVIDGAGNAVEEITGGDSDEKDVTVNENDPTADNDLVEITEDDDIEDDLDKGKNDEDLERIREEQKYYDKGADKNPATGADAYAAASAIAGGAAMVAYLTKKRIQDDTDSRRR